MKDGEFVVRQRSYIEAEVSELMGLYLLTRIKKIVYIDMQGPWTNRGCERGGEKMVAKRRNCSNSLKNLELKVVQNERENTSCRMGYNKKKKKEEIAIYA